MNEILALIANSDSTALLVISIVSVTTIVYLLTNQDYSNKRTEVILRCSDNVTMKSQESLAKVVAVSHSNNKIAVIREEVVKNMLEFTEFLHQEKDKRDERLGKIERQSVFSFLRKG